MPTCFEVVSKVSRNGEWVVGHMYLPPIFDHTFNIVTFPIRDFNGFLVRVVVDVPIYSRPHWEPTVCCDHVWFLVFSERCHLWGRSILLHPMKHEVTFYVSN